MSKPQEGTDPQAPGPLGTLPAHTAAHFTGEPTGVRAGVGEGSLRSVSRGACGHVSSGAGPSPGLAWFLMPPRWPFFR